jgi:hypothetical protein
VPRVKIQLADNIKRVAFVNTDATQGATIGTDLYLADGSVATLASLAAALGVGTTTSSNSGGVSDHHLLTSLTTGDDHTQYTRRDILTANGDIYVQLAGVVSRLAVGSAGQVLGITAGLPAWVAQLTPANPTGHVGVAAANGTAVTYMRSDAAPAIDLGMIPTWTAAHTFSVTPVVPNASWTYAKIQDVAATSRLLGRITAGAGSIEELTGTQATSLLNVFTSLLSGLAPASGGGTTNFLRADGTWAAPAGGGGGGFAPQLAWAGVG